MMKQLEWLLTSVVHLTFLPEAVVTSAGVAEWHVHSFLTTVVYSPAYYSKLQQAAASGREAGQIADSSNQCPR